MNRYGKRCVLYPRVSTEMQVDGYSLEGQKNMLTRFADREEMIVVDTYEDAGKSGKSIEGRPAFQKMLRDIEDGLDIDYILVYKLSRFGRNAADILNSLELVQSYGVNLICIEEGIDSSQTSGKLLISVLSAVAEIERENIIEQTMNGRREKARQGGWNGGFAPYGYTLEDNKLMIEETEAVAIRKIFELYTSSEIGLGGIANQLNLQGIRKIPRQNGTLEDWTGHFIKLILDNPVYCGKIRMLKEKGIAVFFEDENINTLTMDGELLLVVLSSVAQQEVENISSNVKKGLKMKMQRGELVGFQGCLGYDYNKETKSISVNEKEAEIVRYIFNRYIEGAGCTVIANELENLGYKTKYGSSRWMQSTVIGIIKNEKYKGDLLLGKTFTVDPISKRRLENFGEEDRFYIRDHHQPIISEEIFEEAQRILAKRNVNRGVHQEGQKRNKFSRKYAFSCMIKCGFCGGTLTRRNWHSSSVYTKTI